MASFTTTLPAAAVEFCPQDGFQHLFVCGTYKLEDPSTSLSADTLDGESTSHDQKRTGRCLLFEADQDNHFQIVQEKDLPGVLDMKWCHRSASADPILGIADSEGDISLLRLTVRDTGMSRFNSLQSLRCASKRGILCLSLDWSNRRSPSTALGSLITSLSDGTLCLLLPSDSGEFQLCEKWNAHDYEPWVAAWNYWDSNIIFSGGDDMYFKGWDIRSGFHAPIFSNKKSFQAGITSIQSNPHVEHLLAVGSYDDTVHIFDVRNCNKPLTLTELNVGGGAWRVKWHPDARRKHDLLVACMYDGAKVIHYDPNGHTRILKRFDQHESIVYGADWSFSPVCVSAADSEWAETTVATCSFYDKSLHIWSA